MDPSITLLMSRDDHYHQRGYWVVIHAIRDAGMEVVLGGIQTPREIAATAMQEDVDVIGYRIMQGAPNILVPLLFEGLKEMGIEDKPLVVGGIVPEKDERLLRNIGVKEVFHPFTPLKTIVKRVRALGIEYRKGVRSGGLTKDLRTNA